MPQNLLKLTPKLRRIVTSRKKTPVSVQHHLREQKAARERWTVPDTPFYVGQKKVYLPYFTITLLRTPFQPPTLARFHVPLWFSKLDLRDYLFHTYSVAILSTRSFVKYIPVRPPPLARQSPKRFYAPKPRKYMTVELKDPFVWPDEPSEEVLEREFENKRGEEMRDGLKVKNEADARRELETERRERMGRLGEMARKMLSGEVKWGRGEDGGGINLPRR
ncbi:MAG: hypothetical protein M1828_000727 [Chrysothrix sp. TS-e1954]|nr:MAG: hypothetical protein M1828_000727 [Chrysothrix sp. TS-e1954]